MRKVWRLKLLSKNLRKQLKTGQKIEIQMMDKPRYPRVQPRLMRKKEMADKPGSVVDNHSSGTDVTVCLKQPTQEQYGPYLFTEVNCSSIWSCSRWGLPCHDCCQSCGALLPHHFNLTCYHKGNERYIFCGTFRRLSPPRSYLAPCPMEPGLSSPPDILGRDCLAISREKF